MIYIAVAVIVLVVLAGLVIYNHTESSDTTESVNATATDNLTNNSTEGSINSSSSEGSTGSSSSTGSTDSSGSKAKIDYSDYETEQYVDSDGLICLRDIGDRVTYAEHKEWQGRQCDKLDADGYYVTASHRNNTDVDGYTAYDANGKAVVHIDA